jgi:cytoskeletal protein RodZ
MSTVAEQLRQAREARNLTVQQVAQITKIRTDHLVALEEGNFNVFSAPVYIRGFVRSYSALLKLDVPQVMASLDAELGATQKFSEPPPLAEHSHGALDFIMLQLSKVDWRKAVIGLLVVGVLVACFSAAASWRRSKAANPLNGLKPGVYQSTQNVSGETLPLPAPGPKPTRPTWAYPAHYRWPWLFRSSQCCAP